MYFVRLFDSLLEGISAAMAGTAFTVIATAALMSVYSLITWNWSWTRYANLGTVAAVFDYIWLPWAIATASLLPLLEEFMPDKR